MSDAYDDARQRVADHVTEVAVRAEELAAVPGQVECFGIHGERTPDGFEPPVVPVSPRPCPTCGAAV